MTIARTNNAELKLIIELLEEEGYIINSVVGGNGMGHPKDDKEVVMQKGNIQINIFDLRFN